MVITELQDPEDNISGFECIYSGGRSHEHYNSSEKQQHS